MTEPLSKIRRVNVVKRPVMRPPPVPLAHGFGGEKEVCIRECYDKYCEIVEAQSNKNKRCVTVTGTPDIGKSVFYAYFFDRFRKTHKNVCIIAASYTERRGGV